MTRKARRKRTLAVSALVASATVVTPAAAAGVELRDRRLGYLEAPKPDVILSANIGCITHLASGTATRVMHWIEWLDERLNPR